MFVKLPDEHWTILVFPLITMLIEIADELIAVSQRGRLISFVNVEFVADRRNERSWRTNFTAGPRD